MIQIISNFAGQKHGVVIVDKSTDSSPILF